MCPRYHIAEGGLRLLVGALAATIAAAACGDDVGSAEVSTALNAHPMVEAIVPDPTRIDVGETTWLELVASDPDGDALEAAWDADCAGTFEDPYALSPSFTLDAATAGDSCTLSVTVTDGRGGEAEGEVVVETGAALVPEP